MINLEDAFKMGCNCMPNFTRQQWLVTITFIVINLFNAMCFSMQAPFYPIEAEMKGCTPSEYGLVFGVFELVVFLVSPIIGANLNRLGIKATLCTGIGAVGVSTVLFGLLDKLENGKVFLAFSFVLRIIAAAGNGAFLTGSFSLIGSVSSHIIIIIYMLDEKNQVYNSDFFIT